MGNDRPNYAHYLTFAAAAVLSPFVVACSGGSSCERGGRCVDTADSDVTSLTATDSVTSTSGGATSATGQGNTSQGSDSATGATTATSVTTGPPKFDLPPEPPPPDMGEKGPIIPETCAQAEAGESTVGCLFYAVDLDSHDLAENLPYAVAVANVQLAQDAEVLIEQKVGGAWQTVAGPQTVGALQLATFQLPDKHANKSQLLAGGAYRVSSTVPVIAYQFNPVDGQSSYLSDASMLYPAPTLDTINRVTGLIGLVDNTNTNLYAYATLVGTQDGTQVEVTPLAATQAGPGIPAGSPNTPFNITLNEGDVANIAVAQLGTSISGLKANSTAPIAVFSGHECALIPNPTCCCDHTEEQLAGVRLWGTNFIASRLPMRNPGNPEAVFWQIQASEDGTQVTLTADPNVTGLPPSPINLNAGQVVEFNATGPAGAPGDFAVASNKPINVVGYMIGSEACCGSTGDPAMVQMSPIEQYLPRYVVLVPGTWINDYLVITRPEGAPITIDGAPVNDGDFLPVPGTGYEVGRISIPDGVHVLDGGNTPFSVVVVGFDAYDSYAYLGGTGTGIINPNPPG
ncbi:MAG: hypothetical protein D6705_14720 [Deltaproteobacteria bacterium]|nr:MAG: hypothetical protein D6705_14720 [Deltaproteobacteria bacterium]